MSKCKFCGIEIYWHDKWRYFSGAKMPLIKKSDGGYREHKCRKRKSFIREKWFNNYGPRVIYSNG